MRVAVSKIEGVTSATVSLNKGMATVQLAPSNRVSIEEIREVIRSNGFTPKEAEVRVAGVMIQRGDTLALSIPGTPELFALQDFPEGRELDVLRQVAPNTAVTLMGQMPASTGRSAKLQVLLVRSVITGDDNAASRRNNR